MKGVIFSEFTEMVESRFGLACIDAHFKECDLLSNGIYSANRTHPQQHSPVLLTIHLNHGND